MADRVVHVGPFIKCTLFCLALVAFIGSVTWAAHNYISDEAAPLFFLVSCLASMGFIGLWIEVFKGHPIRWFRTTRWRW